VEACRREGRRLAGVLIDDGRDVDRSTIGGGVELEVHRHTRSGASAVGGFDALEVPSRLRRYSCGTCKPFSRHSRWIFLWLTRTGEIVSLSASEGDIPSPAAGGRSLWPEVCAPTG